MTNDIDNGSEGPEVAVVVGEYWRAGLATRMLIALERSALANGLERIQAD